MREYEGKEERKLRAVVCNCCGRRLSVREGMLKEECIPVEHLFGYFGRKDGIRLKFDLCEDCLAKITDSFLIPPEETEESELL